MFTGLVERTGILVERTLQGEAGRIRIRSGEWDDPIELGESVAVDGVCLTVVSCDDGVLMFDVLKETFDRTTLGAKPEGSPVNLERALRAGGHMGGHIVNGHVDGVGAVADFRETGRDWVLTIQADPELMDGVVYKGCISINGVSLTIADVQDDRFSVHLIPETLRRTSLSEAKAGDAVNLEVDVVGKFIRHYLEKGKGVPGITWESLRKQGLLPADEA